MGSMDKRDVEIKSSFSGRVEEFGRKMTTWLKFLIAGGGSPGLPRCRAKTGASAPGYQSALSLSRHFFPNSKGHLFVHRHGTLPQETFYDHHSRPRDRKNVEGSNGTQRHRGPRASDPMRFICNARARQRNRGRTAVLKPWPPYAVGSPTWTRDEAGHGPKWKRNGWLDTSANPPIASSRSRLMGMPRRSNFLRR